MTLLKPPFDKDRLAEILKNKVLLSELWLRADSLGKEKATERDYQRIFTELVRQLYPEYYTEMISDIPVANISHGYDIRLHTPEICYYIEVKTEDSKKLEASQINRITEVFGFSFLAYAILVFDRVHRVVFYFKTLGQYNDYLKKRGKA